MEEMKSEMTAPEYQGRVLTLVSTDHPILREPIPEFDFAPESGYPPLYDPVQLAYDLVQSMMSHRGIGLAANQVGVKARAFAIHSIPNMIVCFNPVILATGDEQVMLDEGCLSFPGIIVKIRRPRTIRVRYTMPNGERETRTFDGMTARVFQHELDHLDGICHLSRAHPMHRERAMRKHQLNLRKKKK